MNKTINNENKNKNKNSYKIKSYAFQALISNIEPYVCTIFVLLFFLNNFIVYFHSSQNNTTAEQTKHKTNRIMSTIAGVCILAFIYMAVLIFILR